MDVNEAAQWAAIVFIGIFVFGLTRQLGLFLVDRREQAAHDLGPAVGRSVPTDVLPDPQRAQLLEAMERRGTQRGALVVVGEDCIGCDSLIGRLHDEGRPERVALAFLSRKSDRRHRKMLDELADAVVVNKDAMDKANLRASPFVMLVDERLKVLDKQIAPDLHAVVARWEEQTGEELGARESAAGTNGNGNLDSNSLTVVSGRKEG